MEAVILAIVSKVDNLTILVLLSMLAGCAYLHLVWRKEDREDRRSAFDALNKNTDAITQLRITLAAISGKNT